MPYGDKSYEDAARHPLHAAAQDGRLADLRAGLTANDREGTLAAGTPCRAQLPLSPLTRAGPAWRQR